MRTDATLLTLMGGKPFPVIEVPSPFSGFYVLYDSIMKLISGK